MISDSDTSTLEIYQFSEPEAEIHVYSNALILNKRLYLPRSLRSKRKLPTMYKGWFSRQATHLKYKYFFLGKNNSPLIKKTLLIFDTWGTSSYYHLLIDHIIPLWITREWAKDNFTCSSQDFEYFRISQNNYPREINAFNEIFSHFFDKPFLEEVQGKYEQVIYGYLYSYRPYHGPENELHGYLNYSEYLNKFRNTFLSSSKSRSRNLILVPKRLDRDFKFVQDFVDRHAKDFNFQFVDFSKMSIQEQIRICNSARIMFGSEGAAFANIVFMPEKSLIMPVSNQLKRFNFHAPLASYLNFTFAPIVLDESGEPILSEDSILEIISKFAREN
jgi:hypothetical protein